MKYLFFALAALSLITACHAQTDNAYAEQYRPQVHFSPKKGWMNDPNGMVYYKGVYHLFYQYYPAGTTWGPMHWGHATSTDLIHWQEQPIALYPDSLGYIFSGSAVVDINNTSGFGKNGQPPLVAIFTHHDTTGEKQGSKTFQKQSLAYSNDEGKTWIKYAANPVLDNPGIIDFRDPKVMWYAPQKKWIMTLATKDCITFYASPDLKQWTKESEFGKAAGAHGGVWECPDLFPMDDQGKTIWVLLVNLNPGGPNGGSATQYFTGDFDGHTFTASHTDTRWLDYGPDEYAGITWSNTGKRKIFIGWMSNWQYANLVPSANWRNATTLAKELSLKHIVDQVYVTSRPVKELDRIASKPVTLENFTINDQQGLPETIQPQLPCRLDLNMDQLSDFAFTFYNDDHEEIIVGYDKIQNLYFIDRAHSGKTDFYPSFAARQTAPRLTDKTTMDLTLIIDVSAVELFADDGLSVMTAVFFPSKPYDKFSMKAPQNMVVKKLKFTALKSIW